MIQFGRSSSLSEGSLFRGGASSQGGQNTGNLNSMSPYNADLSSPLPFSGNSGVILLPKKQVAESYDICKIYEKECAAAGQTAVQPYMEKSLLRPNPHPSKVVDPQEAPMEMSVGDCRPSTRAEEPRPRELCLPPSKYPEPANIFASKNTTRH